jgi:hypothetical protein
MSKSISKTSNHIQRNGKFYTGDLFDGKTVNRLLGTLESQFFNFDITSTEWASGSGVENEETFVAFLSGLLEFSTIIITDFNFVGNRIFCNLIADASGKSFGFISGITEVKGIGELQGLDSIDFSFNNISSFDLNFPLPQETRVLNLNFNQLTSFEQELPNSLEELLIGYNNISSISNDYVFPNNLKRLELYNNNLSVFTTPLPQNLEDIFFDNNNFTLASYASMESWADNLHEGLSGNIISFTGNTDSVSGTNLESILINKGWNVDT